MASTTLTKSISSHDAQDLIVTVSSNSREEGTRRSMNVPAPQDRPEARAYSIEDLVRYMHQGRVRVPSFQRGLKWTHQDVLTLFDSIFRGLPVGSLLFWKHHAPAARLEVGPLHVDAPEVAEALWVVDGQQRLTAITAGLSHPLPLPVDRSDEYIVYFDAATTSFHSSPHGGQAPSTWVELPHLLDSSGLSEFAHDWEHSRDRTLRQALFEAGKRIREFQVPVYIVDADDQDVLREIFFRINKTGRPLEWSEVHDALYGGDTNKPATITELSRDLASLGMGVVADNELTRCLLALRGLDVTRTLAEHHRRDPELLRGAVSDARPALLASLLFLRARASIAHLRLLPRSFILETLTRFFFLHPTPNERSLTLLARWVWRALLYSTVYDERSLRRQSVLEIGENEERSVQELLALLPARQELSLDFSKPFDSRATQSRMVLLSLSLLGPRDLRDGSPIDVAGLLEAEGNAAFRVLLTDPGATPGSAANRMIHPAMRGCRAAILQRWRAYGPNDSVLASHCISEAAALALSEGNPADFLGHRVNELVVSLQGVAGRLAGWGQPDRPSIEYLLQEPEGDEE